MPPKTGCAAFKTATARALSRIPQVGYPNSQMALDVPILPPTLLLFAKDLLFETRIRTTAEALGIALRSARDSRTVLGLLANDDVTGLIVDLDCGDDAVAVVEAARQARASLRIVAYGPHVQAALFERAAAAGANALLPRSRFVQELPDILRGMVSTAASERSGP